MNEKFAQQRWKPGESGNLKGRPPKAQIKRRYPKTDLTKKKVSAIYSARRQGLDRAAAAKLMAEMVGKPITVTSFNSVLSYFFGTVKWPLPLAKPELSKAARKRINTLRQLSEEGASKSEAMTEIGVGEVAFNRFMHRYFGSVVWPIGGEAAYSGPKPAERERAAPATTERLAGNGMVMIPIEITDEILAKYLARKVGQGVPLQVAIDSLEAFRFRWAEIVGLCTEMAAS
jgi:hypothetical protein